jgi:hypothetical protein
MIAITNYRGSLLLELATDCGIFAILPDNGTTTFSLGSRKRACDKLRAGKFLINHEQV